MTGKTRMLGAGRAGSTSYGSNVNLVQFGNKLQGLAPQATHFFIAGNGPAGWVNYQTRTYAPKRNFVFCMNRLGGIGRGKSQFKIGGLNNPDGSRSCKPYDYIKQKETFEEKNIITKKLPNKLEKDSDNDLELSTGSTSELKTDISENNNELQYGRGFLGKSRFYTLNLLKYSSNEPPSRFTNEVGEINSPLKMEISKINGKILRISTPYPLQEDELEYLMSTFTLEYENENDAINLNYSFNNPYDPSNSGVYCAQGYGGFSYSTTYVFIMRRRTYNIPTCQLLRSTYVKFIPPNDLIFLEAQQIIGTNESECNVIVQSYDLSDTNSVSNDITTDINVLANKPFLRSLDLKQLQDYVKSELDLYKFDEETSAGISGSGYNGECLDTYLLIPFCNWFRYLPKVYYDFNNVNFYTVVKIRRDIFKSKNPYSTEQGNSSYISLSLDWGDNEDRDADFTGTNVNTVPEINILFSDWVENSDNEYLYIVGTNDPEFYSSALKESLPSILDKYNIPPLINLTTEEGDIVKAFLLSTTQITNVGLLLRLKNPSEELGELMDELPCYPNPQTNLNQNSNSVLNGQLYSYINAQIYSKEIQLS